MEGTEDVKGLQGDWMALDRALSGYLHYLRQRGRSTLSDAMRGALIESGEAEMLLAELSREHSDTKLNTGN